MKGYWANLEELTKANTNFRQVVYTGKHSQLVLMCLKPGEEIGLETHQEVDQFFRFESGKGKVIIEENEYVVQDGAGVVVPAGAKHNVINTGEMELKLYTIYSPPEHKDKTIRSSKEEAMAQEEHFDGMTSEG